MYSRYYNNNENNNNENNNNENNNNENNNNNNNDNNIRSTSCRPSRRTRPLTGTSRPPWFARLVKYQIKLLITINQITIPIIITDNIWSPPWPARQGRRGPRGGKISNKIYQIKYQIKYFICYQIKWYFICYRIKYQIKLLIIWINHEFYQCYTHFKAAYTHIKAAAVREVVPSNKRSNKINIVLNRMLRSTPISGGHGGHVNKI